MEEKKPFLKPRDIALIMIEAALFAVGCIASGYLVVIPGVLMLRPAAAFAPLFGVLFGPLIGGVGCFIGSFTWILLLYPASSWTIPISAFGDALFAAIPGLLVKEYPPKTWKVALSAILGGGVMAILQGTAVYLLGWMPLLYGIAVMFAADAPMGAVGGSILVALLHKKIKAIGLYRPIKSKP